MTDETLSKISGNIRRNMNLDLCQVHPGQVKFCLYPWLILDWQYQIFQEHVVKAQSRHEAKRDLTQWTAINHRLFSQNGLLFKGLTEDEREEVTDAMDEMETALHNDLVRLMLAVKDAVPSDDLSVSMPISAGYACACLASAAQEIRHNIRHRPDNNRQRRHTLQHTDRTGEPRHQGTVREVPQLDLALCKPARRDERGVRQEHKGPEDHAAEQDGAVGIEGNGRRP